MTIPRLPTTHPLPVASLDEARTLQDKLVRAIAEELPGERLFSSDAGLPPEWGRPRTTAAVERVLARTFGAPAAALVQGAGTGAIRTAMSAGPWAANVRKVLIHDAPVYPTTATTFRDGGVEATVVDFNDSQALGSKLNAMEEGSWVYVQHTRQRLCDSYDPLEVVELAKHHGHRVIVDENYAVMRTPEIGCARGADASAFSLFKLHGPVGVGAVLGDPELIAQIHRYNYSGGSQIQGHQALSALQSMVMAPLNWAEQSRQSQILCDELKGGAVSAVVDARLANAQDLCVLALLKEPVEERVRARAAELGAAPYPVGSNSYFEIAPLIYRMSNTALQDLPELKGWVLRINPMRASAGHIIDMLRTVTQ